jgi:hypothetical protein
MLHIGQNNIPVNTKITTTIKVVDEFAAIDGLEPGNMPVLQCGNCGGELKCVD